MHEPSTFLLELEIIATRNGIGRNNRAKKKIQDRIIIKEKVRESMEEFTATRNVGR